MKTLTWAFGLMLLTVIGGISWAAYNGQLAIVSTRDYVATVETDYSGIINIECKVVKYVSFGSEERMIISTKDNWISSSCNDHYLNHASTRTWRITH